MVAAAALTLLARRFATVAPRRRRLCRLSALLAATLAVMGIVIYRSPANGGPLVGVEVCGAALITAILADVLRARPSRTKARPIG
ncbi:hypothetical protein ACFYNO_07405 [Kitasatospora sp. NPDC006697]|uniref:hypothetical protein n=1 Tax=Kitasatospora sp. NPDC006697 TaxID=3364020 RepID=UPI0036780BE5